MNEHQQNSITCYISKLMQLLKFTMPNGVQLGDLIEVKECTECTDFRGLTYVHSCHMYLMDEDPHFEHYHIIIKSPRITIKYLMHYLHYAVRSSDYINIYLDDSYKTIQIPLISLDKQLLIEEKINQLAYFKCIRAIDYM